MDEWRHRATKKERDMSKHAKIKERMPWNVRKHYWLNRWHYFIKPDIKKAIGGLFK